MKPDAISEDEEEEKPRKKKVKTDTEEWSDDDKYVIKKPKSDMEKRRK